MYSFPLPPFWWVVLDDVTSSDVTGRTGRWRWCSWLRWRKPLRLWSPFTTTSWTTTSTSGCPFPSPPSDRWPLSGRSERRASDWPAAQTDRPRGYLSVPTASLVSWWQMMSQPRVMAMATEVTEHIPEQTE